MPFATLLLISFGLHALIGWSLASDLSAFATAAPGALWGLLLLSSVLLPAGFLLRRSARASWTRALNALGFAFMGLFSSLFVLTLLREAVLLPAWLAQLAWPQALDLAGWRSQSALATVVLALAITVWGYLNARRTASVVRVDIPVPGLPDALHGFSMAQISDIHVGPTIRTAYLQRIVARVNQLDADLVAITGDLVDGSVHELAHHVEPLRHLNSTHGTFFVTGNHEYYSGVEPWLAVLRGLGVQVLMNEHVVLHHHHDAQRADGGGGRLRSAAVGPYPRWAILALEPFRAAAATIHGRSESSADLVGLHQQGNGLLGPAQAFRCTVGDHPPAAGARSRRISAGMARRDQTARPMTAFAYVSDFCACIRTHQYSCLPLSFPPPKALNA